MTVRISMPVLQEIYPPALVCDLLSQMHRWEKRERKLSHLTMVYLLISWHLFLDESLRSVFLHLSAGLRLLGQMPASCVPTRGAFLYRRKQVGVRLLRTLMRRACPPRATPQTPGAFAFGYRLTAIDGT
ncbi:MAG: transposase domain-containing protein, partial [Ktedonobacteraceae bacterium]|nr:transposase domain-containing protein [Ktedonobacteraceae bacterium]